MELSELKKNAIIELSIQIYDKTFSVYSKVLFTKDLFILVPKITLNNQVIGFVKECKIDLLTIIDSQPIIWENVIIKPVSYKGEIYHKIDSSALGKPCNRRNAFRTYIGLEVPMKMNQSYIDDVFLVLLKDLSENGCAIISDENFKVDDQFHIGLRDHEFTLKLSGKIIRIENNEDLQKTVYACKLVDVPVELGKYLVKKQIEKRKTK